MCDRSAGGRLVPGSFKAADPLHGARMATCPECEFDEIDTEDFEEGDTLSCPECGKSLVMVGNDDLEVADDDDEDLDDDDLDEDEEDDDDDDDDDLDDDDEVEDEEDFDE
jgi:alpha-aminoadipate/glutamate carrier protein LysW